MPPRIPTIIAFTGAAGAGKNTAADAIPYACKYPVTFMEFAGPLRAGLEAMLGIPEHATRDRTLKELPCHPYENVTVRRLMQTLGDEWGRCVVGKDVWVQRAKMNYDALRKDPPRLVVFTDCRYANEAEWVRSEGGVVVRIDRLGLPYDPQDHRSKVILADRLVDYSLLNCGPIGGFRSAVRELLEHLNLA